MKRLILLLTLMTLGLFPRAASAQGLLGGLVSDITQTVSTVAGDLLGQPQAVIVRTNLGLSGLKNICLANGCTVVRNLDGIENQVFLVQPAQGLLPS
ncbi:MAG: hypothetical protein WBD21_02945, partial [Candidatus Acidiferrales bacterium]